MICLLNILNSNVNTKTIFLVFVEFYHIDFYLHCELYSNMCMCVRFARVQSATVWNVKKEADRTTHLHSPR